MLFDAFDTGKNRQIFRNHDQKKQCSALWLWVILPLLNMGRVTILLRTHHFNVVIFESYSTEIKE